MKLNIEPEAAAGFDSEDWVPGNPNPCGAYVLTFSTYG